MCGGLVSGGTAILKKGEGRLLKSGGAWIFDNEIARTEALFRKTIAEAARSAHKRLRQIEFRTQCADHPILWSGDENSYYLKFFIFQVTDEK